MKNYNEVADSVFQRSDEIIADNRRRKKKIMSVGVPIMCCILVAAVGFGTNWKEFVTNDPTNIIEPTDIENPTEDPTPAVTEPVTEEEPTDDDPDIDNSQGGDGDSEGTGGGAYEAYDHAYARKAGGLDSKLMDYIFENLDPNFYDWLNKWDEEHKWHLGYYTSSPEKPVLVQVIETFNVPKEVYERINAENIAICEKNGWNSMITDSYFNQEEIDALFSRDAFLISEVFASKYAIITPDGLACCPRYYLRATTDELAEYGITEQQVKEKTDLLLKDEIIIIQDGEILLYYGESYGESITKELY